MLMYRALHLTYPCHPVTFSVSFVHAIRQWIGQMSNLEVLSAASTSVSGTIPTEIAECLNLTKISFQNSFNISGSLPTEIWSLPSLTSLNTQGLLIDVEFVDSKSGEVYFTRNSSLRELMLSQNVIADTIPTQISFLESLEILQIGSANVQGIIPSGKL
jgi:hypothetical protein